MRRRAVPELLQRDVQAFLKLNKGIDFRRIARPRIIEDDASPQADSEASMPTALTRATDQEKREQIGNLRAFQQTHAA